MHVVREIGYQFLVFCFVMAVCAIFLRTLFLILGVLDRVRWFLRNI